MIGLATLFFVKLRPRKAGGCLMTLIIGLLALASITWISGATTYIQEVISIPWDIPTLPAQEMEFSAPQKTIESVNTLPPTSGSTLTATLEIEKSATPLPTPSPQPTKTLTPSPTPIFAVIFTQNAEGANVRMDPEGEILVSIPDGTLMEVLPGSQVVNGFTWIHVRTPDGDEGWIIQDLITIMTPTLEP